MNRRKTTRQGSGEIPKWHALRLKWQLRYGDIRFRLMDISCLGYLAVIGGLLVFFHNGVTRWPFYVLLHTVLVLAILEIIRLGETYPQARLLWILRTFYPLLVIMYAWDELNALVTMVYGNHWTTAYIVSLDKLLFGVHPTVWVQGLYRPWLDEVMSIAYGAYLLLMPIVSLTLFLRGKREETLAAFSIISFIYLTNFMLFYLLPTVSPLISPGLEGLHTTPYSGYLAAKWVRQIVERGTVVGAAFPSSHVTGALACTLAALLYERKLGYALLPVALGVTVATVYLGYHHALDPICAILWVAVCYPVARGLLRRRGEDPSSDPIAVPTCR